MLGRKRVEDTRPRVVGSFLEQLQREKGLSAATARKARTVLSAVLSYAMEYVESNAAMKVPPPETDATERVAPTLEETARILLEAEVSDPDFLTYLWVAAETGGRRGETLALRWSGVDFDAGTVSIEGTVSIGDDGAQLRSRTKTVPQGGSVVANARPSPRAQGAVQESAGGGGRRTARGRPECARVQRRGRNQARPVAFDDTNLAALTTIPARLGARRPTAQTLQAELA